MEHSENSEPERIQAERTIERSAASTNSGDNSVREVLERVQLVPPSPPIQRFLSRYDRKPSGNSRSDIPSSKHPAIQALRELAHHLQWVSVILLSAQVLGRIPLELSDAESVNLMLDMPELSITLDPVAILEPLLPHEKLIAIMLRILALLRIRDLASAVAEVEALGDLDASQYCFESFPVEYPNFIGSMVPFELHLLRVEVLVRTKHHQAVRDLYKILVELDASLEEFDNGKDEGRCESRSGLLRAQRNVVLCNLIHHHLMAAQYDSASDSARRLVNVNSDDAHAFFILSRVLLYTGNLEYAKLALQVGEAKKNAERVDVHMHRGLLFARQGLIEQAGDEFEAASVLEPEHVMSSNNAAVCMLHMGLLSDAVERLEGVFENDTVAALDEGLVFNLCSTYDLRYPESSKTKKQEILKIARKQARQGFNTKCITLR
mmetsp:Transcript_785/g.1434  ORF Transcript_785/g.1434 Transcript_785/m.1434 type:complete len:435 (-) Transcript_785:641-1945(-)